MWPGYHVIDLFTDMIVTSLLVSVAGKGFTTPADPRETDQLLQWSGVVMVRPGRGIDISRAMVLKSTH